MVINSILNVIRDNLSAWIRAKKGSFELRKGKGTQTSFKVRTQK